MTREEMLREIGSLPPEGQRLVESFIAFLRQRYASSPPAERAADDSLQNERFIGMWRGRDDLQDSSSWVRGVRESEWAEVRRRRINKMFEAADHLADSGEPLTEDEVEAEITAAREGRTPPYESTHRRQV
jgi:hypothetical protein